MENSDTRKNFAKNKYFLFVIILLTTLFVVYSIVWTSIGYHYKKLVAQKINATPTIKYKTLKLRGFPVNFTMEFENVFIELPQAMSLRLERLLLTRVLFAKKMEVHFGNIVYFDGTQKYKVNIDQANEISLAFNKSRQTNMYLPSSTVNIKSIQILDFNDENKKDVLWNLNNILVNYNVNVDKVQQVVHIDCNIDPIVAADNSEKYSVLFDNDFILKSQETLTDESDSLPKSILRLNKFSFNNITDEFGINLDGIGKFKTNKTALEGLEDLLFTLRIDGFDKLGNYMVTHKGSAAELLNSALQILLVLPSHDNSNETTKYFVFEKKPDSVNLTINGLSLNDIIRNLTTLSK